MAAIFTFLWTKINWDLGMVINHTNCFMSEVITHPCYNFNSDLLSIIQVKHGKDYLQATIYVDAITYPCHKCGF